MSRTITRRQLLGVSAAAGAVAGVGELTLLGLPAVSAAEASLDPNQVRLNSDIEPLVQFLENTPREELLEQVAARIRRGLSYRELLAALLLAGVRNVQPRPSVGHKFHAVLVVNSAHLASMSSPPEHRWLPIFWALDYFKEAQARDVREGNWTMGRVDEGSVPAAYRAERSFREAMDDWNEGAADAAVASLARSAGANELYELFFRYGARDFRSIGHKAIYVANSYRTLQCIGWHHAEPVVRSLAYALLMHEGDNPARRDAEADRPYRRNLELQAKIRDEWRAGKPDRAATEEMLAALRTADNDACCDLVVELLNRGTAPQSIWDALHVGAGELLMRQPAIVALHAVTTTNALYFAYQAAGDDTTRRLMLLQNAAFLPMFREAMRGRGRVNDSQVDLFGTAESEGAPPSPDEIFADLNRNPMQAAQGVHRFLQQGGSAQQLIDAGRVLIFRKGTNAHDYKFSSAVLEDYYHVSPEWRAAYMASNVFRLRGAGERDNNLFERTRAALA